MTSFSWTGLSGNVRTSSLEASLCQSDVLEALPFSMSSNQCVLLGSDSFSGRPENDLSRLFRTGS